MPNRLLLQTAVLLSEHRAALIALCRAIGIRQTAHNAGLSPMAVSRYCSNAGSDDALTHYAIAAAFECTPQLDIPAPPREDHPCDARTRKSTHRSPKAKAY